MLYKKKKELNTLNRKLINLGCLENLVDADIDITDFLAAIGVKYPTIYMKVIGFDSTPGGVEVTVEAVSQVKEDLIALEKELDVSPEFEKTFNWNFNDEIPKLVKALYDTEKDIPGTPTIKCFDCGKILSVKEIEYLQKIEKENGSTLEHELAEMEKDYFLKTHGYSCSDCYEE